MDLFSLVDTDMLRKVISQLKPSTCLLDPIPTTFFKTVYSCPFPTTLKPAMVKPLLKKSNPDSSALSNFWPISNPARENAERQIQIKYYKNQTFMKSHM